MLPLYISYYKTINTTAIHFFDVCHFRYGWDMLQYLPTHGFTWMTDEEVLNFNVNDVADDSEDPRD